MDVPIWIYWEGEYPDWVRACHATIFNHAADVRLITPESFDAIRDRDRDLDLSCLCIAHRADFIRAFLLAKYGGLWIDSDCIVLKSLATLLDRLDEYDFFGFRERQGNIANNFIGARPGSLIAGDFYDRVCAILRSGEKIEWLTLGSDALTATMQHLGIPWFEINVELIQPVCWSRPEAFFIKRDEEGHNAVFNEQAYCYMLSGNMISGVLRADPSTNILDEHTFFSFLLRKSSAQKWAARRKNIAYRPHTDDDAWVIPEVIDADMYEVKDRLSSLEPASDSYVIDCGAHIGAFSIMCAHYFRKAAVISFEPNPDSFLYLCRNADLFRNICALNKAVDTKDGTLSLFAPDDEDWSGRWTAIPNANRYLTVESVNLFSFIKNLDKPVFILKFDIEGYEDLIIEKASKEDLSGIRIIIVETHTERFNHTKMKELGFDLLFQPHISSSRQYVYTRA